MMFNLRMECLESRFFLAADLGTVNESIFPNLLDPPSSNDEVLTVEAGTAMAFGAAQSAADTSTPLVSLNTNFGQIQIELFPDSAPLTVENFLNYVQNGAYDGSFFHRLIPGFVLQGGGFTASTANINATDFQVDSVPTDSPVINEFEISNTRGTVAMAKLGGDPDSATSQFFLNLVDNSGNLDFQNGGFTVFGEIVDMTVVDQIAAFSTVNLGGAATGAPADNDQLVRITSATTPEAEEDDLVAFAQDLSDAGVRMFGAPWCPSCTRQKELFDDGAQFLDFIDVTNPDRSPNQIAIDEAIASYPTWDLGNGVRRTEVLTVAEISELSGVPIPTSNQPFIAPLEDVTLQGGSPQHIAIDNYDPNGGLLEVTVSSSDPDLVSATLTSTSNRSARLSFAGWGDFLVHMFEQRAPRPTSVVAELAEQDVYDNTIFHRIIDEFMIQGGDPTGTGSGDPELPDFDDQFHPDLQHTTKDVASFAKSADDTNSSQFFFTEIPTRHLDFNHSVWGLIVEGSSVREAISNTETESGDQPTFDVVLNNLTIETDIENHVLMISAPEEATGQATVTVKVTDSNGNSFQRTFEVTVEADPINNHPFLHEIKNLGIQTGRTTTIPVMAQDIEGDEIEFAFAPPDNLTAEFVETVITPVDGVAAAQLQITPDSGFFGTQELLIGVFPVNGTAGSEDIQELTVEISAHPWQNSIQVNDVNEDGLVTITDVFLIANYIWQNGAGALYEPYIFPDQIMAIDTTGDSYVSAADVFNVVGEILDARQAAQSSLSSNYPMAHASSVQLSNRATFEKAAIDDSFAALVVEESKSLSVANPPNDGRSLTDNPFFVSHPISTSISSGNRPTPLEWKASDEYFATLAANERTPK